MATLNVILHSGIDNEAQLPPFAEAVRELINIFEHHIQKLSNAYKETGDLHILFTLVINVFFNIARDYIVSYIAALNKPPSEGLKYYQELVTLIHDHLLDNVTVNIFNHPPEGWTKDAIKV